MQDLAGTSFDWHGDLWKDEELNGVLHDMPGPVTRPDETDDCTTSATEYTRRWGRQKDDGLDAS